MMKHIYLLVFLLIGVVLVCMGQPSRELENYRRQINHCIQSGNAEGLSNYFRDMVELAINQSVETYSKLQATSILSDFFRTSPVESFEEMETWKDGEVVHVIGNYWSAKDVMFRVHYMMKKSNPKKHEYLIYSITIEQTKTCKQKPNVSKK